jgi:hypothetical protein
MNKEIIASPTRAIICLNKCHIRNMSICITTTEYHRLEMVITNSHHTSSQKVFTIHFNVQHMSISKLLLYIDEKNV